MAGLLDLTLNPPKISLQLNRIIAAPFAVHAPY